MIGYHSHPDIVELQSFASRTGEAQQSHRVASHLATCVRCQDDVRSLRTLRGVLSDLPSPSLSPASWDDVARRTARGELLLLPVDDQSLAAELSPRTTHWTKAAVAAAIAVAIFTLVPSSRNRLDAGATVGELSITPHTPRSSNTVDVVYRPAAALARGDSVVLHANLFKTERYFNPATATFTLRRANTDFSGEVTLPPDAVLASFTIGSAADAQVDDNDGRRWEFIPRDSLDRPIFDGLQVQYFTHNQDDWEKSFAAAKEMARLYPENPAGLRALLSATHALAGPGGADSVNREFRPRLDALQRKYWDASVSEGLIWEMATLSGNVGDTASQRHWVDRSTREFPRTAGSIQLRVFSIFNTTTSDAERMRKLDALWVETGGDAVQLLANAFSLADKMHDPVEVERWGTRSSTRPGWNVSVAATYVRYDQLRAKGEAMAREALRDLPPVSATDWNAALHQPGRPNAQSQAQQLLTSLGVALLHDGAPVAAVDTLRRAATLSWNVNVLSLVGDAALAARDSVEASRAYAWVIADSRTPLARADSLRARLGTRGHGAAFDAAVADGHQILDRMTLATTYRRRFETGAAFVQLDGVRKSFTGALPHGISVVAMISRFCAPSIADMSALQTLHDRLAARGIPVIVLTKETPSDSAAQSIARHGYHGALLFDDRAEVSRALRSTGTPNYFVIEGRNTVLADRYKASDIFAIIDAHERR